ncbi:MAG: DUF1987 domain-containing protein [Bacteroidota bacterium]|jgi:hypothetical protein
MNTLFLEPTEYSPRVKFTPDEHCLEITGISRPEDVIGFYEPLLQRINQYLSMLEELDEETRKDIIITLVFDLEYINSASSKYLLQVISHFKQLLDKGMEVEVYWYYEDPDDQILEDGEDLSEVLKVPFRFVTRDEE